MEKNGNYLVRTSLHLSRQKFGKIRALNEEGVILSLSENKALFALQRLLDKTNYKGNLEGHDISADNNKFQFDGFLPRIQFTPTEFLLAYGLNRTKSKRGYQEFNSNERTEAMNALKSLADKKFKIVYERKRWVDKKTRPLNDVIIAESPLIQIMWGILGLTDEEKKIYDDGGFTDEELLRRTTIAVEFAPILVDQITGYFLLIPETIYDDVKKQVPKAKYSHYIPLFIEWLILQAEIQRRAKTGWKVEINYKKLAIKLRMDKLIRQRKWRKIRDHLKECYDIAAKLEYIVNFETQDGVHDSKEVFYLNKERFYESTK